MPDSPPRTSAALEVSRSRRAVRAAVALVLLVALLAVLLWYTTHPPELATSEETRQAATPVGVPVYVAMAPAPTDRSLAIDGVKLRVTANTDVDVRPLLCRDGSPGVTSDPAAYCSELVDPEGQRLEPGDSLLVEVAADEPAIVVVDRIRVGYQDGIRAATQPAGVDHAVVNVLGR